MNNRFKNLTIEEINIVNYYTVKKLENKNIKELMLINQEFNPKLLKISEALAKGVKRTNLANGNQSNFEVIKCIGKLTELADIKSQLNDNATPDLIKKKGNLERNLEHYNKSMKSKRLAFKKPSNRYI